MRKNGLAACLALLLLSLFLLASCALLTPTETTSPKTTPPETAPPEEVSALTALQALFDGASPDTVVCTVVYEDPRIGVPLRAETALSFDGELGVLTYRYDMPSPIGTGEFLSSVSGSASGNLSFRQCIRVDGNKQVCLGIIGNVCPLF